MPRTLTAWAAGVWLAGAVHAGAVGEGTGPLPTKTEMSDLIVLDLYPHLDHAHVGSLLQVTRGDGVAGQPHFEDSQRVLFSWTKGETSGVYVFDVMEEEVSLFIEAPRGAYSPKVIPGGGGISVLKVAEEGMGQHLYRFPREESQGIRLLPEVPDIESYAWAGERSIAFRRESQPSRLFLGDLETGEILHVQDHVGGNLQEVPGESAVSFVDRSDPEQWFVRRVDGTTGETTSLVDTPPGSEHHAWMSAQTLVMGYEGILYRFTAGQSTQWTPLVDLRAYVGDFAWFAVSPSGLRIALLVQP